ncbi:hypothetical protein OH77DRAFT_1432342 [Trametes cingulata]|nr:hypothetical protein OH77DRAFT_1432342 [Trametes cingulata]
MRGTPFSPLTASDWPGTDTATAATAAATATAVAAAATAATAAVVPASPQASSVKVTSCTTRPLDSLDIADADSQGPSKRSRLIEPIEHSSGNRPAHLPSCAH